MQMLWNGIQLQIRERTQSSGKRTPVPSRPETTKEDDNRRDRSKGDVKIEEDSWKTRSQSQTNEEAQKTDKRKSQADSDVSAEEDTHSSNDEYVPEPVKTKPKPDR